MFILKIIIAVILVLIIIAAYISAEQDFQNFLVENGAGTEIFKKHKRNKIVVFSTAIITMLSLMAVCIFFVPSFNMMNSFKEKDNYTDETIDEGFNSDVFDDVENTWAEEAVMYLANEGIVSGIGDNKFGAENNITRAEFVTMLVRMLENKMNVNSDISNVDEFSDVANEKYYSVYLTKAKALGIASGYEGNQFRPDNTIARQDMFTFTERALKTIGKMSNYDDYDIYSFYNDATSISGYALNSIRNLTASGIISGNNNTIRPLDLAKRNEAAQMLYSIIKYVEIEESQNIDTNDDMAAVEIIEPKTEETTISEYVIPNSSSVYLTEEDLIGFSPEMLRLARNEIYARHGRKFKDNNLSAYFNSMSWYTPTIEPDSFKESYLSDIEKYNVQLIYNREQAIK